MPGIEAQTRPALPQEALQALRPGSRARRLARTQPGLEREAPMLRAPVKVRQAWVPVRAAAVPRPP